jgi:hypothetical protein
MPDIFDEIAPNTQKGDIFDEIVTKPNIAERVTNYVFPQWLTEAQFQGGQQNIYGDIFNRSGTAIRAAIQAPAGQRWQAYQKGANVPEQVPSFTESMYLKSNIQPTGNKLLDFARAYPSALAGTVADIATNPADLLTFMSGKKIGQTISQEAQKAQPLLKGALQKISPIAQTAKRGLEKAGRVTLSKFPRIMGKDYTLNRAKQATQLLDETRSYLGKIKGEAVKQYGDMSIDVNKLQSQIPTLPKNVLSALDDPIYAIEKLSDGSIKPTVSNLDKVREALGDLMTSAQWEEATTKNKQLIKNTYGLLGRTIKETSPQIKEPIENYHRFMELYRNVNKTLRNTTGDVLEKRLRGTFTSGAERNYQIAWENMYKRYIPQLKQIAIDVQKFNQRQVLKRGIKKYAPWVIGGTVLGGAGYGGLRRALGNIGNE